MASSKLITLIVLNIYINLSDKELISLLDYHFEYCYIIYRTKIYLSVSSSTAL